MLGALQGTTYWPSPRRQWVRIWIDRHKLQVTDSAPVVLSTIRSIEVLRGTEDSFKGWRAVILFGEAGQQQQALYAPLCLDAEYPADTVQQLVTRVRAANSAVRVSDLDSSGSKSFHDHLSSN